MQEKQQVPDIEYQIKKLNLNIEILKNVIKINQYALSQILDRIEALENEKNKIETKEKENETSTMYR